MVCSRNREIQPLIFVWNGIRSIFITQTLFEIALLDDEDLESMRQEVQEALDSEGGWTKGALLKFRKIDSALREVGRVYGLMHCKQPSSPISSRETRSYLTD
jgi:predicted Zn-dependent protease